jgi:hypothetical protein
MPAVLISCPYADWFVPTGQTADHLEDLRIGSVLRRCPECGRDHEWSPTDAMIAAPSHGSLGRPPGKDPLTKR